MKTVFTVGEIAAICGVSATTVRGWFDSGLLIGYRLPGSKARRVHRTTLIRFVREQGMAEMEPAVAQYDQTGEDE